jgi:branched-chain amino acid transport system substrate-binding protein
VALFAGCTGGDGGSNGDGDGGNGGDGGSDDGGDGGGTPMGEADQGPLLIGGLQGFSGGFPPMTQNHQSGMEYAVSEINENGGVLGRDLAVKSVDTKGEPSTAVTQFTRFVEQDNIIAATGPISSNIGLNVARKAEELEVPFLPHIAASHELLSKESRYTFRTASHPSPGFAEGAALLIEEQGYSKGGVIYADFAWGLSYKALLNANLSNSVILEEATAPISQSDFTSYMRQMSSDIEFLLAAGHPQGSVPMYLQSLQLDISPKIVPGSAVTPELMWSGVGSKLVGPWGQYTITNFHTDAYQEKAAQYAEDTGEFFGASDVAGYIIPYLVQAGIEESGKATPAGLADGLRDMSLDTYFHAPIEYTEWGEFDGLPLAYESFVEGGPDFHQDLEWWLDEFYKTPPLEPFDPTTEI